jgi:hypothetical protein
VKVVAAVVGCAVLYATLDTFALRSAGSLTSTGTPDAVIAVRAFDALLAFGFALVVSIVLSIVVTSIAGGDPKRWNQAAAAGAMLLLIGLCAAGISPATFLIPLLLYGVLFIYTMPVVLIGGYPGMSALFESSRVGTANVWQTVALVALIAVIWMIGGFLGGYVARWAPFGGWLVAGLVQQGIVAYAALTVARRYASHRSEGGL